MLMVIITEDILNKGRNKFGRFNISQIYLFGYKPEFKNWEKEIIGKKYPKSIVNTFIDYRNLSEGKIKRKNKRKPFKGIIEKKIPWSKKKRQYKDSRWVELRKKIRRRDKHKCRYCYTNKKMLHVHHLKYFGDYLWDTPDKYLITLCEDCHNRLHRSKKFKKEINKKFLA